VLGLQLVTVGDKATDMAEKLRADNKYQDYLYLHGFGGEVTPMLAGFEQLHACERGLPRFGQAGLSKAISPAAISLVEKIPDRGASSEPKPLPAACAYARARRALRQTHRRSRGGRDNPDYLLSARSFFRHVGCFVSDGDELQSEHVILSGFEPTGRNH